MRKMWVDGCFGPGGSCGELWFHKLTVALQQGAQCIGPSF